MVADLYYIAEVGINHEGDFNTAIEYCRKAKEVGANAVKFQWVKAERAYEKGTESYKVFKNSYLSLDEMQKINNFCEELSIDFFATPGDMETLYDLAKINNKIVKISSGLATHRYLIKEAARLFKTLIVSTGTLFLDEIIELNKFLSELKCDYIILKCTSEYPCQDQNLNLDSIPFLRELLKNNIGYSCHSLDSLPSCVAVSLGANVIEKHFSFDISRSGYDHSISFDVDQTKNLINKLRRISQIKSWDGKLPAEVEKIKRNKMHRYMFPKRDLEKNYEINLKDFYFLRSDYIEKSKMISACYSLEVEGKKLFHPCKSNTPLLKKHLEE